MKNRPLINSIWTRRGLAIGAIGLLSLGALKAKAEHYYIHDQLLVSGTQRPDPAQKDGMHFIQDLSVGASAGLGIFKEYSSYGLSPTTEANGVKIVVITGQGVIDFANGNQLFYSFHGSITMSSAAGLRNFNAQASTCSVRVTGGTGVFNGVLGSGEMTCLMDSTGRFSSRSDLTLSVVGEK